MSLFENTSSSLIQLAIECLASGSHFTAAQKKIRTEAVVCAIMAFLPSEPVQTMLASQAVGHHFTVMDTFREIDVRALTETGSVRMRMASATQTRMMLALVRELRIVRKHHIAAVEAEQTAIRAARAPQPEQAPPPPADTAVVETNMRTFEEAVSATAATLEQAVALDKPTADKARRGLAEASGPGGTQSRPPSGAPSGTPGRPASNGRAIMAGDAAD